MNKKGKPKIWDAIAWLVLIGILILFILKVMGIIQTPSWLEYSPVFGGIYLAGWAMHKLERVSSDVKDLRRFKDATIDQINNIRKTL